MTPSTGRVLYLLTATALRRQVNRMGAMSWGRRKDKDAGRTATVTKRGRSPVLVVLVGALFLLQAFAMSYTFTFSVVRTAERAYAPGKTLTEPPEFGTPIWVEAAPTDAVLRPFAIVFTLLVLAIFFLGLGTGNAELSQVGWSMEWLFTFPVPTRGLVLAKIGEYGLTSIFAWLTVFPLATTLYWCAGWGGAAIAMGLGAAAVVAFSVGSLRVLAESYLRKKMSRHRVKNIQALCTIVGMLLLFAVFALVVRGRAPALLSTLTTYFGELLLFAPGGSIALMSHSLVGGLVVLAWAVLAIGGGLVATNSLLSNGLVSGGGPYSGERGRAGPSRVGGILAKDLLLLLRDRNIMMQTLVLPAIIVGFQFLVNPALMSAGSPRGVAVLAFGVAAYVLVFGGFSVLTAERNALWLLYSLPQRLDRLFVRKTVLWGGVAIVYATAVLAVAWRPHESMELIDWMSPGFVLIGVVLHAFLAGAMGVLGADPFETEIHKKVRPEWSMLYMLVAANYGITLATGDLWAVLVLHVLLAFVVVAMWDRVAARLPYLLDPSASPVRRIQASDGLIGAFIFFALQQIALYVAIKVGVPEPFALTTTYAFAGALTIGFGALWFWRSKVRDVLDDLGLRVFSPKKILLGALAGLACAGVAAVYLHTVPVAEDATLRSRAFFLDNTEMRNAVLLLTIVLAPLVEEILFRGLLFTGMQRIMRPWFAVLGSAVVFGVIHPAISFAPVFVLGIGTALVFNRTRSIWAAIVTHMTYNAIVVAANII